MSILLDESLVDNPDKQWRGFGRVWIMAERGANHIGSPPAQSIRKTTL